MQRQYLWAATKRCVRVFGSSPSPTSLLSSLSLSSSLSLFSSSLSSALLLSSSLSSSSLSSPMTGLLPAGPPGGPCGPCGPTPPRAPAGPGGPGLPAGPGAPGRHLTFPLLLRRREEVLFSEDSIRRLLSSTLLSL